MSCQSMMRYCNSKTTIERAIKDFNSKKLPQRPRDPVIPLVIHLPHSSTCVPHECRSDFVITDI